MINQYVYRNLEKIGHPTVRSVANQLARLVLENWLYLLFVIFLWRFPYIVASLSDSEVMPRRPTGESVFWQSVMAQTLLTACLAMSYNLLFGFAGVISFGHALFFGIGAYITFVLISQWDGASLRVPALIAVGVLAAVALLRRVAWTNVLAFVVIGAALTFLLLPGEGDISFFQAIGFAVLGSIALSLLSGVVTLRLRGVYFTMFTLALAEMFWVLAKSGTFRNLTGAEDGLPVRDLIPEAFNPTPTGDGSRLDMYRWTIVFFVLVFLAIRRYINSPVGRVMVSIRENEDRARTIGYNVFYFKLMSMAFAGLLATLSGILFVLWSSTKRVDPSLLSLNYTVEPLLITLIGGLGTLTGPVIAALGLEMGRTYLREETFTLSTQVFGLVPMWAMLTVAVLLLFFYAVRAQIKALAVSLTLRLVPPAATNEKAYRRYRDGIATLLVIGFTLVGLTVVYGIYEQSDLSDTVYEVADLWNLFQGIVFIIVVMLLPHGIVGTWNRWRITRQVRKMQREMLAHHEGRG